jgi:quercetin dioxygenase-like cupin family protein
MMRLALAIVTGMIVMPSWAIAEDGEVFDLTAELKKADQTRPAVNRSLIKTPEYTVNAVAIKREIETHRHDDGSHVLYIVSGRGTATLDGKPVTLKPGTVVHIPKGVSHSIKVEGGKMTFLDFVQHHFDPNQAEKK